jgi:beta-lactamase superfamily II metal-dependent hydrolase
VDARERERNDRIQVRQGDRNPFIDHEDWIRRAWPDINTTRATAVLTVMGLKIPLEGPTSPLVAAEKPINDIRVHSLNVGAGSCHIIECPGNTAPILYDCGRTTRSDPDMTDAEVISYVRNVLEKYEAPPIVIVSHGDADHYRYVPAIMNGRLASTVWYGGLLADYPNELQQWFATQEKGGVSVMGGLSDLPPGFSNNRKPVPALACGAASTFVLTVNEGTTKNSKSLVVRIEHADFSATFTGDATGATQNSATANFKNLQTTLLTGSHHGAQTQDSNSSAWAKALQPSITLFSSGTAFGHPRCTASARYESFLMPSQAHDAQCGVSNSEFRSFETTRAQYVTRINGTVVVSSDGESPPAIECSLSDDCGP